MAKFYISFQKTNLVSEDDVGQDFPSLDEARAAAMASARELLSQDVKFAPRDSLIAVIITDEEGRELDRISVKEVLPESLR
jgi:hypothetical protein